MASIRDDLSTGKRLYIQTRFGEPVVERLKELGAHWDRDVKCWWVGRSAKSEKAIALLVAADQAEDDARARGEPAPAPKPDDPHSIRLVGKCRYKGRDYYCSFLGPTKRGYSAKLHTLPDADGKYLTFWAEAAQPEQQHLHDGSTAIAVLTKTYQPRQVWDGRRYSGRTVEQHTTLGSIADFIRRQADPATRRVQCPECDSWHDAGEPCRECGGC